MVHGSGPVPPRLLSLPPLLSPPSSNFSRSLVHPRHHLPAIYASYRMERHRELKRTSSVPTSPREVKPDEPKVVKKLQRASSTGSPLIASKPARTRSRILSRQRSEVLAVQASGSSSTSEISNQVLEAALATNQWTISESTPDRSQYVLPPN